MLLDIFDPKAPPQAIGIDLGTTNSIVAHVRDGRPVPLTTCDGSALLPSVVHYGAEGSVLVGRNAAAYADARTRAHDRQREALHGSRRGGRARRAPRRVQVRAG